jgi:hypothetical protein
MKRMNAGFLVFPVLHMVTGYCGWGANAIQIRFVTGKSGTTYPPKPDTGIKAWRENSSVIGFVNVVIVVDYTLPYSACSAPSAVSVSENNVSPSKTVAVSWLGAGAGNSNPIAGYQIYRSASPDGAYGLLGTVYTSTTSGSFAVTAPTNNGETYYYKVWFINCLCSTDMLLFSTGHNIHIL